MAVVSYSVLAFSPCATAKKPASRCHASLSCTTVDPECDFFMLELLLCRHWSCWGRYMRCEAVSCPSTTCDLLRVPVGELRETSHSICRSVRGNTASVRLLPGQPDACIPGNIHSCYFLLSIEPILNVQPWQSNQRSLPLTIALQVTQFPQNATLSPLRATTSKGPHTHTPHLAQHLGLTSHHTVLSIQSHPQRTRQRIRA